MLQCIRHGVCILPLLLATALPGPLPAGSSAPLGDFGDNPGALDAVLYTPDGAAPGLPLLVALHGCSMSAEAFEAETGLTALADALPALLLLPQQREDNQMHSCFRWYDEEDNLPGRGESASIMQMIDHVLATDGADPAQVYVLGLSAGGGMTAAMIAGHPDRFAGGGIVAGPPYGCNRPRSDWDGFWHWWRWMRVIPALDGGDAALACGIKVTTPTTDRAPEDWARYVREAAGDGDHDWPLISIWQGAADGTVDPGNLTELTEQWTAVQGIDATPASTETIDGAIRKLYLGADGTPRIETWELPGFDHAMPIDADGDPAPCGEARDFITDAGICAVRAMARFWGLL
ncbi:PHB depolymerase family esterase [Salipiger sp. HF18]|uniref:extracellular catalytic domain type 1 short-chain-length polyhydroxyalkanoate depolymerase n=1 Tax=Salipiger sp. HF18 TaxID=2721557 RepID=UPI00142E1C63|nr:PHB depolymerase family esterase [Salipiger sp. HF18]NIY98704.1 PHB depolymerase family esterase [Salipiger sp. HF18]